MVGLTNDNKFRLAISSILRKCTSVDHLVLLLAMSIITTKTVLVNATHSTET